MSKINWKLNHSLIMNLYKYETNSLFLNYLILILYKFSISWKNPTFLSPTMNDSSVEEYRIVTHLGSDDDESETESNQEKVRKKRTQYTWQLLREFETAALSKEWVQTQALSKMTLYETEIGEKRLFHCIIQKTCSFCRQRWRAWTETGC